MNSTQTTVTWKQEFIAGHLKGIVMSQSLTFATREAANAHAEWVKKNPVIKPYGSSYKLRRSDVGVN